MKNFSLRLFHALAIVCIIAIVYSSTAWKTTHLPPPLVPPYPEPPVAQFFPNDIDIRKLLGNNMLLTANRPPDATIYLSNDTFTRELRSRTVDFAWQRKWEDPSAPHEITITVEQLKMSHTAPYAADCQIQTRDQNSVASKSGWFYKSDQMEGYCLVLHRGRIHASIKVTSALEKSPEPPREVASLLATNLFNRITPPTDPERPSDLSTMTSYGARIKWAFLGTVVMFILMRSLILYPRQQLRSLRRRKGNTPTSFHFDTGPERDKIVLRQRGFFILRVITCAAIVRASELVPALADLRTLSATLVIVTLTLIYLERLATRGGQTKKRSLIRGIGKVLLILGIMSSAALLAVATSLFFRGFELMAFARATNDSAQWEFKRAGGVAGIAALGLFTISPLPLMIARRLAMWTMKNRKSSLDGPVLMLRTFGDDHIEMHVKRRDRAGFLDGLLLKHRERFEELITLNLSKYGPPIAVGMPGQILPPGLGAQRYTYSDDTWQDAVKTHADNARYICLTVGRTAGLSWEMGLVSESEYLHKTVFVIPPVDPTELRLRLHLFSLAYCLPKEILQPVANCPSTPLAICWPKGWTEPFIAHSRKADDISYDVALDACIKMLRNPPDPPDEQTSAAPVFFEIPPVCLPRQEGTQARYRKHLAIIALWLTTPLWSGSITTLLTGNYAPTLRDTARYIKSKSPHVINILSFQDDAATGVSLRSLETADFTQKKSTLLAPLRNVAHRAVSADGVIYYVGLHPASYKKGYLAAVDASNGKEIWNKTLPENTNDISFNNGEVAVTFPIASQVSFYKASTGEQIAISEPLGCTPWSLEAAGDDFLVSCPHLGKIHRLHGHQLLSSLEVSVGTTKAFACGERIFTYNPSRAEAGFLGEPPRPLANPDPALTCDARRVAISDIDRIIVIDNTGEEVWNSLPRIKAIYLSPEGDIVYWASGSWARIKAPK